MTIWELKAVWDNYWTRLAYNYKSHEFSCALSHLHCQFTRVIIILSKSKCYHSHHLASPRQDFMFAKDVKDISLTLKHSRLLLNLPVFWCDNSEQRITSTHLYGTVIRPTKLLQWLATNCSDLSLTRNDCRCCRCMFAHWISVYMS